MSDDYRDQDTWFEVQGSYGFGWEPVTAKDTRKDAEQALREYNANEPQFPHRVRKVRGQS